MIVFPEPVAICTSARGRFRKSESSKLMTACNWLGKRNARSTGGTARRRARRDEGLVSSAAVKVPALFTQASSVSAASHSARVAGWCTWKMRRLRGSGSRRLVNFVIAPVDR
jgi:hypothetical protein